MNNDNRFRYRWAMFSTWNTSKDKTRFREDFYNNNKTLNTPVIEFGSKIAHLLETDRNNILVADIPKYEYAEFPLIANFGHFTVISHPDAFDMETLAIADHKTCSVADKKIKANFISKDGIKYYEPCEEGSHEIMVGWTETKLAKWEQTVFYTALARKIWGTYNPMTHIIEIPTVKIENKGRYGIRDYYDRKKLPDGSYAPCIMHERPVTEKELDAMDRKIIKVYREIEEDYSNWLIS